MTIHISYDTLCNMCRPQLSTLPAPPKEAEFTVRSLIIDTLTVHHLVSTQLFLSKTEYNSYWIGDQEMRLIED